MLKKISVFLCMLICTICLSLISESAYAATLHKDLPMGAPAQGIVMKTGKNFSDTKPVFTKTAGTAWTWYDKIYTAWGGAWDNDGGVCYNATSSSGKLPGSFSLRWNDMAVDQNGRDVDIVLTVSNVDPHGYSKWLQPIMMHKGIPYAASIAWENGASGNWVSMDLTYNFYVHGTNTPATGDFVTYFTDLDTIGTNGNAVREGVRLKSGFSNDIHIVPDDYHDPANKSHSQKGCYLNSTDNNTFFYTGITGDDDTLQTGFMVSARNGFTFTWQGGGFTLAWDGVGTGILQGYANRKITATSGTGGSISSPGTTIVGWKNNKTYTMTPQAGYGVKDVKVDGKSVGKRTSYTFNTVTVDHTIHVDWQPLGAVGVCKSSQDTSLSVTDRYSVAGAQYTLYSNALCTVLAKDYNGNNVVLTTGANGQAQTSKVLVDGTYYLKETKPSPGYRLDPSVHTVSISNGSTVVIDSLEPPQRGYINLSKVSKAPSWTSGNGCYSLAGATYDVYRGSVKVATLTTDESGNTNTFVAPLGVYTVKESSPSPGYRLDPTTYTVDIAVDEQSKHFDSVETPLIDIYPLKLHKLDADAERSNHGNDAQGGLSLAGAKYSVKYYDGYYTSVLQTAPLAAKWEKTYTTSIDSNGQATLTVPDGDKFSDGTNQMGWPLGTYVIEEIEAPFGYYLDDKDPYITQITKATADTGENSVVVGRTEVAGNALISEGNAIISADEPKRTDLMLMKYGEPTTDQDQNPDKKVPQEGVVFDIINNNEHDVYRVDAQTWAAPGEVVYSLTTDEQGYASTQDIAYRSGVRNALPCGNYIIHERPETSHPGYAPMQDKELVATTPERVYRWVVENKVGTPLQIVKMDKETNRQVRGFTSFSLLNANKETITFTSHYPVDSKMSVLTTDIQGSVILPEKLMPGTYYVKEIKAPDGYTISDELVAFTVDASTVNAWDVPLVVRYSDIPVRGVITVNNIDAETEKKIVHSSSVIEVRAKTDIVTPDGTVRARQDEVVWTGTTVDGSFETDELYLGEYYVSQIDAPDGYLHNVNQYDVSLEFEGDKTALVRASVDVPNISQKGTINIVLNDLESDLPILHDSSQSGGTFEIKAKEDIITPDGTIHYKAGDVVGIVSTDETGKTTSSPLPLGKYEIVETQAPEGYVIDRTPIDVSLVFDETKDAVSVSTIARNMPQKGHIRVNKVDSESMLPIAMEGAVFEIVASSDVMTADGIIHAHAGEVVAKIETMSTGVAITQEPLYLGHYTVHESKAPKGYMLDDTARCEVELTYCGQDSELTDIASSTVVISDPAALGEATITKRDVGTKQSIKVAGIQIDIVAKEDVVGADGIVYHRKGDVVASLATDEAGTVHVGELRCGHYEAVQRTAPPGYGINPSPVPIDIEYVDDKTPPSPVEIDILDTPFTGRINICKLDTESKSPITHDAAVFDVYALEDIMTADGTVRAHVGDVVGHLETNEQGTAEIAGLFPGRYRVHESKAPNGYVATDSDYELELTAAEQSTVSLDMENKKQTVVIDIEKIDSESKKPILVPGVEFIVVPTEDVLEPDGDIKYKAGEAVCTVITDETGHARTPELLPGKYAVIEKTPAPGYLLNSKPLAVETAYDSDAGELVEVFVQHEGIMPRGTILIEKLDKSDPDVKLAAATFSLYAKDDIVSGDGVIHATAEEEIASGQTDEDGMLAFSDLRQGTYILHETSAPDGYLPAEDKEIAIFYEYDASSDGEDLDVFDEMQQPQSSSEEANGSTNPIDDEAVLDDIDVIMVKEKVLDSPISLSVKKVDETGKMLPGCKLALYSEDGTDKIDEWTTTEEPYRISPIPIGRYVLKEVAACEGYDVAEDIVVEVSTSGDNEVVMVDKRSAAADELVETEAEPPAPDEVEITPAGDVVMALALSSLMFLASMVIFAISRLRRR